MLVGEKEAGGSDGVPTFLTAEGLRKGMTPQRPPPLRHGEGPLLLVHDPENRALGDCPGGKAWSLAAHAPTGKGALHNFIWSLVNFFFHYADQRSWWLRRQ